MIWVLGELRGKALATVAYEALEAGRALSGFLKAELNLILLGWGLEDPAKGALKKADRIYLLEHQLLGSYTNDGYRKALKEFLRDKTVSALIISGTSMGKDLGPLLAVSLGLSCLTNVIGIEVINHQIHLKRPLYGSTIIETVTLNGSAIISILPRSFEKARDREKEGERIKIEARLNEQDIRVRSEGIVREVEGRDITEAEILVSGGRGVGGPEGFALLEELASSLGGLTAASRTAVDAGWAPHAIQVGQTGKVVSPLLYIACGISGAPQHLSGMRTSRYVMAINKSPQAPIFREADIGMTGDLFEAIPELLKEIKRVKESPF